MVIIACILNFQRALGLLIFTLLAVFFFFWDWLMEHYGSWMWEASSPIRSLLSRNWFWMRWCGMSTNTEASSEPIQKGTICKQPDGSNFGQNAPKFYGMVCCHMSFLFDLCRVLYMSLLVLVVSWLALDTAKQGTRQIVSFFGLLLYIFLMLLFSKHPFHVRHAPTNPPAHPLSLPHTQTHRSLMMFAVVLAGFDLGDSAPVHHRPAHLQDLFWHLSAEVGCTQSRGTPIIPDNCFIKLTFVSYLLPVCCFLVVPPQTTNNVTGQVLFSFTDVGSKFVFGEKYIDHPFAFKVRHTVEPQPQSSSDYLTHAHTHVWYDDDDDLDSPQVMPVLLFLSAIVSVLYYIGFMPWLICKVRWCNKRHGGEQYFSLKQPFF